MVKLPYNFEPMGPFTFKVSFTLWPVHFPQFFFSYTIEIISPKWRAFAGQMNHIYYAIGCILSSPLSYLYRDWQTFTYSVVGEYWCSNQCGTECGTYVVNKILSNSLSTFAFLVFHSRISQMVIFEEAFG